MLLTDEGCCGVGGASQDYAGFGAMEEGLISREGRNLTPLHILNSSPAQINTRGSNPFLQRRPHGHACPECGRSPAGLRRRILRHLSSRGLYLSLQGILAECLRGNRRIICLKHLSSNRTEPCTILINPSLSSCVSFYSQGLWLWTLGSF